MRAYSKVHVERTFDPQRMNAIMNHPAVRPTIADMPEGRIDATEVMRHETTYALIGDHGAVLLHANIPGIYEVHTNILPEGRGGWTLDFLESAKLWMFAQTDCFEVLTRVPRGHLQAKAATLAAGMTLEFERPKCRFMDKEVPVEIYSIDIAKWASTCPFLEDIGADFHEEIVREWRRNGGTEDGHGYDENHNRYVGAAVAMVRGGQVLKAVNFYNRWAVVSRHPGVRIVSVDPVVVEFDNGYMTVADGEVRIATKNAKNSERAA